MIVQFKNQINKKRPQVILITLFCSKRLFNRTEGRNTERELLYFQYTVNSDETFILKINYIKTYLKKLTAGL